jgi:HSP20 family protein
MAITRWEPFRELLAAQDHFNRLFNDALPRVLGREGEEQLSARMWAPPVDIFETGQNLVMKVELPGIDPKDVEIRVEDNTLYIRGERKFEKDVNEENFHRVERSYGSFARSFTLPSTVDHERVTANYEDGVLTLTLAKREEAKPKTIKIQVAGSEGRAKAAAATTAK